MRHEGGGAARAPLSDADRIRTELAAKGIILEDRPDGTTDWRRTVLTWPGPIIAGRR